MNFFKGKIKTSFFYLLVFTALPFLAGFKVAQNMAVKAADVKAAQKILDLDFNDNEIKMLVRNVERTRQGMKELHAFDIDNSIPPVLWFKPPKGGKPIPAKQATINWDLPKGVNMPEDMKDLAFYTVAELSVLIRERKVTSVELTQFFLNRLKTYGDTLQAVVTLTEERAMASAKKADDLLKRGTWLGPLHGIPYGAKDLFSVPDYKTTWGAGPYKDQNRGDEIATVVKRD